MTNYDANAEFLKESMLERGTSQFGVDKNGNLALCKDMDCVRCIFFRGEEPCHVHRSAWLKTEADPPVHDQFMEAVRLEIIKCANVPCEHCIYSDLDRQTCIATRIRDAAVAKFNITKREDYYD